MELKRYVLLEDNRIIDTTDGKFKVVRAGKDHYRLFKNDAINYEFFAYGKILATSDDVMELVRPKDLILCGDNNIHFTVESIDIKNERIYYYVNEFNTDICSFSRVKKILKPHNNDYICVWRKVE